MTTFTIDTSPPYEIGQRVDVLMLLDPYWNAWQKVGAYPILRVADHELLVRVGGRALAFQRHDGTRWTWTEWTLGAASEDAVQQKMETGDEGQGRLV